MMHTVLFVYNSLCALYKQRMHTVLFVYNSHCALYKPRMHTVLFVYNSLCALCGKWCTRRCLSITVSVHCINRGQVTLLFANRSNAHFPQFTKHLHYAVHIHGWCQIKCSCTKGKISKQVRQQHKSGNIDTIHTCTDGSMSEQIYFVS